MLYVCIDAGQTKTEILATDNEAFSYSWLEKPVINPSKEDGLERLISITTNVVKQLDELNVNNQPLMICYSLSGYHGTDERIPKVIEDTLNKFPINIVKIAVIPDYIGNWYAVTKGEAGIVIISGGGTVAYGRNERGIESRLGGWGHLLGDEGSGYWFGLQMVKAALRSMNGLQKSPAIEEIIRKKFRVSHEFELTDLIYSESITDQDLALLVPLLDQLAEQGDKTAIEIIDEGVWHLAELCRKMSEKIGNVPVHLSGGVFNASSVKSSFIIQFGAVSDQTIRCEASKPLDGILAILKNSYS